MKTLETILKEHGVISYDVRTNAAVAEYLNQFHPTPTEAEINEAAAKHAYSVFNTVHQGSNEYSFRQAIEWLQNYQTHGLCQSSPVTNDKAIGVIEAAIDRISGYISENSVQDQDFNDGLKVALDELEKLKKPYLSR